MTDQGENAVDNHQFTDALTRLRAKFVTSCPERLEVILGAANALRADPGNAVALEQIRRECHKLAGLSGSIGYPEIGDLAGDIDIGLKQGQMTWPDLSPKLDALVVGLQSLEA